MCIATLLFLLSLATAAAQEAPAPSASATVSPPGSPHRSAVLRFALPPLDGTISLGIYDAAGKLVRVLHREDSVSDFTAASDALETTWDGTDDAGNPLPNGKYHGRGYLVGNEVKVEGIDYFFNDWVTDDQSPHVRSLGQLWLESGVLQVGAELAGGKQTTLVCDQSSGAIKGQLPPRAGAHCPDVPSFPNLVSPIDCAAGRNNTIWFVDSLGGAGAREVKQISREGQLLRRLPYSANEPQPERIAASPNDEKIFLIEQDKALQRLRALQLVKTTSAGAEESVSDWKAVFEKKIISHQNFGLENGKPIASLAAGDNALKTVTQKLRPDPLQHEQPGKLELAVGLDEDGSFLQTADGLPLRTISNTPDLTRALISRPNENAVDVFQDDGAVVEQFRISNLEQMIAFDCGEFQL